MAANNNKGDSRSSSLQRVDCRIGEGLTGSEVVFYELVSRGLEQRGAGIKMERAKGFEPSTITLAR